MTIEKNNTSDLECTLSDSDLFTPAFAQSDIEHGYFEDIFPITKLDDSAPIEFLLENTTDKFLDLANTYLKLKLKIVKGDGVQIQQKPIKLLITSCQVYSVKSISILVVASFPCQQTLIHIEA